MFVSDDGFFRATDKFTARSFSQSEQSAPRISRNSKRRDLFFPPPDRLSPTLRPILAIKDSSTTTEKPAIQLSRFHPTGPSKYSTTFKKDKGDDYDEYYEYYDDYVEEESNTTSTSTLGTSKPKSTSLSKHAASSSTFNKPPTAFSKFHTGNFRFTSNNKDINFDSTTSRRTSVTTKSPFRFRFTPSEEKERTTKPTPVAVTPDSSKKGSLADLIAQLKTQISSNGSPTFNDVDSTRDGRVFDNPFIETTSRHSPITAPNFQDLRYSRITNSTESTFAVGSVQSSHSIKNHEEHIPSNFPILKFQYTTLEPPLLTTESRFLSDLLSDFNIQTTQSNDLFHGEERGFLEENLPGENLTEDIPEPEGPPISNSFPSLFENIQIAVDPSLLPPGYSVDEAITETVLKKTKQTEESHVLAPTSSTKPETTSPKEMLTTLEDLFSSLPQEDVTSLLPSDYLSSTTTEPSLKTTSEKISSSTEEIAVNADTENIDTTPVIETTTISTTTEKLTIKVKNVNPDSFLPPGYKPSNDTNDDTENKLPGISVETIDVNAFLPPGYKSSNDTKSKLIDTNEDNENKLPGIPVASVDVSAFLTPGYKPKENDPKEESLLPGAVVKTIDVSKFLPPGYKVPEEESTEKPLPGIAIKSVDIASFLPTGYKPKPEEKEKESSLPEVSVKTVDVSKFLPPGFNSESSPESITTTTQPTSTTLKVGKSGIVFPRRPKRPQSKTATTTTTTSAPDKFGPPPIKPKIQNLFER